MTTAATRLAAGDLMSALAANPFVLLLAGMTAVLPVLLGARLLGAAPPPQPWSPARRRNARRVAAVLAGASWLFELHRSGWI
jgi:hypothetical protein